VNSWIGEETTVSDLEEELHRKRQASTAGDDDRVCRYCRHPAEPESLTCPLCGAPAEIRATISGLQLLAIQRVLALIIRF
jgi:rubrerythrin